MNKITGIALLLFVFTFTCFTYSQTGVDWENRVVVAKGIGAPNPKMPQAAQRPAAIRAAKQLALRNALELIKGIQLNSQTTIKNSMLENDVINTSIQGFISGFEFESKPHYMSDGTIEISVTVPLDGAEGLGKNFFGGQVNMISEQPEKSLSTSSAKSKVFTGLLIDTKGINIKPALIPKILDEDGNEIYGSAYVSRDFAVKYGMCGYAKDVNDAKKRTDRIGKNPFLVKSIKVSGPNKTDPVISSNAANTIKSASENLKFLEECRVIIILD